LDGVLNGNKNVGVVGVVKTFVGVAVDVYVKLFIGVEVDVIVVH
jgi:hypothetical protein